MRDIHFCYNYIIILVAFSTFNSSAQNIPFDTISNSILLENVNIAGYRQNQTVKQMNDIHLGFIYSGKKNEVINLVGLPANIAEKTGRQIFAKIPGAFIYDMDGSGNQVNIATRGLDPHRSWEFNVRQNGVIINSDMYGYPASHYSMPMEAVKNIELVRGTAALQFGAQFGGMINYVLKTPDTTKTLSFESINSAGSFGLLSTYNSIGGKKGKITYFGYYHKRISQGYRDNSKSNSDGQFISIAIDLKRNMSLRFELGRSNYLYKLPGPLTDEMFKTNPRQSTRDRNYYSPSIYVPSIFWNYKLTPDTEIYWTISGLYGDRKSVLFEGFADKRDQLNTTTNQYAHRIVDIDEFNSRTSELRIEHHHKLADKKNVIVAGIRYFNNNMNRRQRGIGTTGTDYDLTVEGDFGRNLNYFSRSVSFSIENMIYLTDKFSVSPGLRYEYGQTDMTGYISYLDPDDIPNVIKHRIPSLGMSMQYKVDGNNRIYGSFSQAHRPVLFKDVIPGSILERANKNLKNAFGYNAEIGISGWFYRVFKYDITLFDLQYNNRLGKLLDTDPDGNSFIFQTNIGNSRTLGIESYMEYFPYKTEKASISIFSSNSTMQGKYANAVIVMGTENRDITGNKLESVPALISRSGVNFGYKGFYSTMLYSYVSQTFSDPANTITPTSNGANGIVPHYGILDINASLLVKGMYTLRFGANNILNHQYFTKRPLIYPGPGVWSSDGQGFVFSFGIKL